MNQSELFNVKSVTKLSPRLEWMARHGLVTKEDDSFDGEEECDYEPWACFNPQQLEREHFAEGCYGTGPTEHDAIVDWAIKNKVKLWNEEGHQP
jgi:hypothetical protein